MQLQIHLPRSQQMHTICGLKLLHSSATPWHWLNCPLPHITSDPSAKIAAKTVPATWRCLTFLSWSMLILYLWAVPTPIWIAPCHNRSIGQECSKCKFGRLYRFNISQLILHTRALTTRSGWQWWHASSPEPVRLLSTDPAPVQLAGFSGGPGHGHLWEALRRPAPMRSWWKSSSPRLWRIWSHSFGLVNLHVIEASGHKKLLRPCCKTSLDPWFQTCPHRQFGVNTWWHRKSKNPYPLRCLYVFTQRCCWAEYQATVLFVFINQVQNHCGLWIIYLYLNCIDVYGHSIDIFLSR